ncbi:MAG: DHA2 family efflux MFS transporter permease subunit [Rickettsiaceae bacterium]|nr:DHA2 family efflux MFS transporter permease subunit [Rickettsiaceae bacterium]
MTILAKYNLSFQDVLAFFAMIVGMFMAILDIQIVSSSLSVIGAGLSASGQELSWIQTSYLIAEVIIIPITGFASKLLSTRISYFIAALGFTVMSGLCSIAWNIESMIIFRAFQGFFGGAMIPTTFGIIFVIFPQELRTKVAMVIGLVVTVAPTIGPTLGGYITEIASWHFMFLINIIPGIFVCTTVFLCAHFDKPNYNLLKNFDSYGILAMIISLGSLQYILEEGNVKGWLEDNVILSFFIITIISFIYLIYRELTYENPIIDLTAFKNKNFTFGCIYSFILGVGLYGSVYLLPLFLFTIAGYNTFQIGTTMIVTGMFQFVSAPIAAKMMESGIDKRIILSIGYLLFALGAYFNSFLTAESGYYELFLPQMVRGLSLMFCFMPINDLALGTIPKADVANASGLYNLTRNLGGAVGLATINNIITNKTKNFFDAISSTVPVNSSAAQEIIMQYEILLNSKMTSSDIAAYGMISDIIHREAFIIAINNTFVIISLLFCFGIILIPFSSTPKNASGESHGH